MTEITYDKNLLPRPPRVKPDGSGYNWTELDRYLQKLSAMLGYVIAGKPYNVPEEIADLKSAAMLDAYGKDASFDDDSILKQLLFGTGSSRTEDKISIDSLLTSPGENPTWENRIKALEESVAGNLVVWALATDATVYSVKSQGYLCIGVTVLVLPVSPEEGDIIGIVDAVGTFDTINLTVSRNGGKIMGLAEDLTVDVKNAAFFIIYSNSTYGWRIIQ